MNKRQEAMKWWNDISHSEKGLYMEGDFKSIPVRDINTEILNTTTRNY